MNSIRRAVAAALCLLFLLSPMCLALGEGEGEGAPQSAAEETSGLENNSPLEPEQPAQPNPPAEPEQPAQPEQPVDTQTPPETDTPEPPVTDTPEPPATDTPEPPVTDTPEPPVTDVPTDEPTDEPSEEPTDEPDEDEVTTELTAGNAVLYVDGKLASFDTQLTVGTTVTIAVPFIYTESYDGTRTAYASHMGGGHALTWSPSSSFTDFDQRVDEEDAFMYHVTHLEVYPSGDLPFVWNQNEPVYVVARANSGNIGALSGMGAPVIGNMVNLGYAVFRDVTLRKDLGTGYCPISLDAVWFDTAHGNELQRTSFTVGSLNVKAKSSGGGGYGGGGGGAAEATPLPKTQLLIDGLKTNPSTVNAGEEFELELSLTNTSTLQKAQNIRLTLAAQDDAILPVEGSSTLYISSIDPEKSATVTIRMKARPDISDKPVKIDATLEFEDAKLNQLTATQSVIMNVQQVQRVRLDTPSVPNDSLFPGDENTVSMGIYNTGHTTLYNVTARVISEGGELTAQQSYYAGNMEPGASKTAELDVVINEAGDFEGQIEVTFEDANGNVTTQSQPFTMSAMEMPTYDEPDPSEYEGPEPVEEPSPVTEILQSPKYMVMIGAVALALICLTVGLIIRHRRKAKDEDEDF